MIYCARSRGKRGVTKSFDQSMARLSAQKKKKINKQSGEAENTISSGYASEAPTVASTDPHSGQESRMGVDEALNKVPDESLKSPPVSPAAEEPTKPSAAKSPSPAKKATKSPSPVKTTGKSSSPAKKASKSPSSSPLKETSPKAKVAHPKIPGKETAKEPQPQPPSNPESIEDQNETQTFADPSETASSLSRRDSTGSSTSGRKVGRLSIPNFNEASNTAPVEPKKPVPSYGGAVSDAKKAFQRRTSGSFEKKDKLPAFIKVGDVKKAFERRSSMPATSITGSLWKGAGTRDPNEAQDAESPAIRAEQENNGRVKSAIGSQWIAEEMEKVQEESGEALNKEAKESPSVNQVDGKQSALDVIKKSIAKAKLKERRSESSELFKNDPSKCPSSVPQSAPIMDPVNSKKPAFAKSPKPFEKLDLKASRYSPEGQTEPIITTPQTATTITSVRDSNPGTPVNPPTKPTPITRSYKKVTFTKDGACITETAKIISEKAPDGTVTKIEKKSKVTHYPSGGSSTSSTKD